MSQSIAILGHLKRNGKINPMQALKSYGCMRLASRVNDLRNQGHSIETTIVERRGKRFAEYSLKQKGRAK
jgi:hypothetical protein